MGKISPSFLAALCALIIFGVTVALLVPQGANHANWPVDEDVLFVETAGSESASAQDSEVVGTALFARLNSGLGELNGQWIRLGSPPPDVLQVATLLPRLRGPPSIFTATGC